MMMIDIKIKKNEKRKIKCHHDEQMSTNKQTNTILLCNDNVDEHDKIID